MDDAVERTIEVELAPSEVWELLVDDDERAGWFGGETTLDPVPGGAGTFTDPDGTTRRAVVEEAQPGHRLSWTWWPDDGGDASRVRIELQPSPGGTRVDVVEAPLVPTAQASLAPTTDFPAVGFELSCLLRASGPALART